MKTSPLISILGATALALCIPSATFAQESGIKVTTTLHADDSRTDLQKDFDAGTAEEKNYDPAGNLLSRKTFKLDDQGRPTEGVAYSAKGAMQYTFTYTLNSQGQISEELDSNAGGQLFRKFVYHYDSNGHISGIDGFDAKGNPLPKADGVTDQSNGSKKKSHR